MAQAMLLSMSGRPRSAESRVRAMFDAHFDCVWRNVRRLGLEEAAADDVTQETFVLAARKLDAIEEGRERSFLIGTAIRLTANARRRHTRRDVSLDADDALDPTSFAPGPDEVVEHRRTLAFLDASLAQLPEDLRVVVVLTEFEALPQPEIAAMLDVPLGTIASRLRRARELLAEAREAREKSPS